MYDSLVMIRLIKHYGTFSLYSDRQTWINPTVSYFASSTINLKEKKKAGKKEKPKKPYNDFFERHKRRQIDLLRQLL